MTVSLAPIAAGRLVLDPVSRPVAEAVVAGDLSTVRPGDGWPQATTFDGLRLALAVGDDPGWFVTLDGAVIGECGTHGPVGADGDVEIGYAIAAPYRGVGYGNELVAGLARWLLGRPDVRRVLARARVDNLPSRRALERGGFRVDREDEGDGEVRYVLARR